MSAVQAKLLMQDILAGLVRLHELLREETAAITAGKDAAILECAAEKQAAISRLMDCAPRIEQLLVRHGLRGCEKTPPRGIPGSLISRR
jgi:hypothetical protein